MTAHRQLVRLDTAMGFGEFCSCQTSPYAVIFALGMRSGGSFSTVANGLTQGRLLLYGSVSNPKTQGLILKVNPKTQGLRV